MSDFTPSIYQEAIFNWIVSGRGDAVINAVAGSGKTTTLCEGVRRITSQSILVVSFNKHIADELGQRLRNTPAVCRTLHSMGNQIVAAHLGKLQVVEHKSRELSKRMIDGRFFNKKSAQRTEYARALEHLAHFARLTLTEVDEDNLDEVWELVGRFDIENVTDDIVDLLPQLLEHIEDEAQINHIIDYDDMLWLPNKWELSGSKFQWVLIDEAQDLNRAQRELTFKLRGDGGRMIFVGDPYQSIYGFAGADTQSFAEIAKALKPTQLPLSVCYRCPASHITLAQELVPHIEPRSDAPEGRVIDIYDDALTNEVKEGDLILCRKNAPLIRLCIKLIGLQIPARMRGRDIGKELANLAFKIANRDPLFIYKNFGKAVESYRQEQMIKLESRENTERQQESLQDKCAALMACFDGFNAKSIEDLAAKIEGLFSDYKPSITLSTIHRAKGLESNRVLILEPQNLPMKWKNQSDEEKQQEQNIKYVALTRAKSDLIFVYPAQNKNPDPGLNLNELLTGGGDPI